MNETYTPYNQQYSFQYNLSRIHQWANESNPWLMGYLGENNEPMYYKISYITTNSSRIYLTNVSIPYGVKSNMPYYGVNLLCELDTAGEYYIDSTQGILYFYPPTNLTSNNGSGLWIGTSSYIITFASNTQYISLIGFQFYYAHVTAINTGAYVYGITVANNSIVGNCWGLTAWEATLLSRGMLCCTLIVRLF